MADGMAIVSSSSLPLTPCTGVCRLDARGLCEGCLRTGDEIARWSTMDDEQKLWLMDRILPGRQGA
ncbi:hypothetical protein SAMN05660880_03475 [Luteibacter sp. 22Crub2.1]|nr:hypothetical protein SAMN04515659_3933 [Dyella sp. 333MFSha]SKB96237.1 hypothetical protein SAMN05660880_03475 [Luteibacter sp. 22Crub2.1]